MTDARKPSGSSAGSTGGGRSGTPASPRPQAGSGTRPAARPSTSAAAAKPASAAPTPRKPPAAIRSGAPAAAEPTDPEVPLPIPARATGATTAIKRPVSASLAPSLTPPGARTAPALSPPVPKAGLERVREVATDQALNAVAILRETWDWFWRTGRAFQLKVGIVAAWLLVSGATVLLAAPQFGHAGQSLGARLAVSTRPGTTEPLYMIRNEGKSDWKNVRVVVNDAFHHGQPLVKAGSELLFDNFKLVDKAGLPAPRGLAPLTIELDSSEGSATLMSNGRLR